MPGRTVDPRFPERMREILALRGISYRTLAAVTFFAKSHLHDLATGKKAPTADAARRIDEALSAGGELAAMVTVITPTAPAGDDFGAAELARRVAASDLSAETLERLERAVDDLAVAYAVSPPAQLLPRVQRHLSYVTKLIDLRKTLDQHRRLLVAGGWLALIGATVHIDLRHQRAGDTHLATARQMATHAENPEILAWCLETRAWERLINGDYAGAMRLSRQAQAVAPPNGSAIIQATAQEGRAWARMGNSTETRDALRRTTELVAPLAPPERPEHHYRYDPSKALAYTATTLSWVGDPAAVGFARDVVDQLDAAGVAIPRPRRMASARLDLALALLAARKPDEASSVAMSAITSGRVVASNWWRATEILTGVARTGIPEAGDLRDAYEAFDPARTA